MLSWLTLAAMGIEGGVAIGAAVAAGSVALPRLATRSERRARQRSW
jgi:hypothetical protein